MSHYMTQKPVILSKHKINVIAHGRPLSPIGSIRSISPYVPRCVKSNPDKENHGRSLPSLRSASTISTADYQRTAQDNLLSISNNLSNMLQETFSGIDNICQKVRLCLIETNALSTPESQHFFSVTKSRIESKLSVCEEENEVLDPKNPSLSESDPIITVAEIIEENVEEKPDIEIKEVKTEEEPLKKPKRSNSLTPFFTILNPTTLSAESVGVKSMSSKLMLSRKCTAENLKHTMKEVEKLTNYENFLTSMVDDINREIDECYSNCQKMGGDTKKNNKKLKRPNTSPVQGNVDGNCQKYTNTAALNVLKKIKKIHKDGNEEHFSDNDLLSKLSPINLKSRHPVLMNEKTDFSYPDVYRKRAITNLFGRMQAQLEANDSFIFFQKLMAKNRKNFEKNRPMSSGSRQSLKNSKIKQPMQYLVSQKAFEKRQNESSMRKKSLTEFLSKKYHDSLWFKKQGKLARKEKHKKKQIETIKNSKFLTKNYSIDSTNSLPSSRQTNRSTSKRSSKESSVSLNGTLSKYEVTVTNNQPLSNSERCRIHWMRTKYSQLSHKRLKYLDILDDISEKDILPFKAEYPRKDEINNTSRNVKDSYLYQMMYGNAKDKAWTELIEPSTKGSNENLKLCSDLPVTQNDKNERQQIEHDKAQVIRTLSKYIFNHKSPSTIFTVMPVHVFYDNPRLNNGPRRAEVVPQKLPLPPMKETKEVVKKAEWMTDLCRRQKPMKVVFDPILRKIEKEIRIVSGRNERKRSPPRMNLTSSWSPKNFSKFCAPHKTAGVRTGSVNIESLQMVQQPSKHVRTAPINENQSTAGLSKGTADSHHPVVPPLWNSTQGINSAVTKKDTIKGIQKELDQQVAKSKDDRKRKIWENKYGKSVGQKLLNFIEKQPSAYQTPIPKYALPKTVKDTNRQKQMLNQLLSLKQKNDDIQVNIQKAIGVIEQKMVDILGKPATQGMEAFDQMEKEISDVLSLMKTNIPRKNCNDNVDSYCNDIDQISKELFTKLDKILESPVLTSEKSSEHNSSRCKKRTKQRFARDRSQTADMKQVCFSSTSASGEEKFTITGISPRKSTKRPMRLLNSSQNADLELLNVQKLRDEIQAQRLKNCNELTDANENPNQVTESINSIPKNLHTSDIKPVVEQVVNLALCSVPKGGFAGDQPEKRKKSINIESPVNYSIEDDDESTHSKGYGDSGNKPFEPRCEKADANGDVTVSQIGEVIQETKIETELEKNSNQTLILNDQTLPEANKDIKELADLYYTPATSPICNIRDTFQVLPQEPDIGSTWQQEPEILNDFTKDFPVKESAEVEDVTCEQPSRESMQELQDISESVALQLSESSEDGHSTTSLEKDEFYKNVTRIITRVETVYSQLDEFEEILSKEEEQQQPKIPIFQDSLTKNEEIPPDTFLTPFMHDVKNLRQAITDKTSPKNSPRICRSPSFFNVINLLDNLTDIKGEMPIEVYTARVLNTALLCHIPQTFCFSWIQNPISYSSTELAHSKVPMKKKSGCLKNPSSLVNMNTSPSKSKQKVSFLLQKEHKASQVTICAVHAKLSTERVLSSDNSTLTSNSYQSKKDQQVSAYLNAQESRSVDNIMSLNEDVTLQTTTEYSEEIVNKLEDPMPEQVVQKTQENIQKHDADENENKKNVVEIFRSGNPEEDGKEKIKIFHDTFVKDKDVIKECLKGFYNDHFITQATNSQNQNFIVKKHDGSVDKLVKSMNSEILYNEIQKEAHLLQTPKNVNHFIDSNLLKRAITERQNLRIMKTRNLCLSLQQKISQDEILDSSAGISSGKKEGLIKGFYAFVYLLMFTALNLEYKCVQ
ncbi:uncharacterized protein LOC126740778 isoform X2 [Anthonomus grandis grandis]|uniref:uncharacterized protein LOC126740778 isoform X2 n=1 Tax=Anthonomus grandis grandis TaxID=2921223 RepID=UPI0021669D47|nr:uncharacterized protein LOC126740778 isoform X2 [Anthonomus grandis grandis]